MAIYHRINASSFITILQSVEEELRTTHEAKFRWKTPSFLQLLSKHKFMIVCTSPCGYNTSNKTRHQTDRVKPINPLSPNSRLLGVVITRTDGLVCSFSRYKHLKWLLLIFRRFCFNMFYSLKTQKNNKESIKTSQITF